MTKQMLVETLIAQICDRYPPTHRLDLGFRDGTYSVYTNSDAVTDLLRCEYNELVVTAARADRILTIVNTLPLRLDGDVLQLDGSTRISVGTCELELLEGGLEHDTEPGILYLINADRDVMIGPCVSHKDAVIDFVFNRYQARLSEYRRRSRPRCGPSSYRQV